MRGAPTRIDRRPRIPPSRSARARRDRQRCRRRGCPRARRTPSGPPDARSHPLTGPGASRRSSDASLAAPAVCGRVTPAARVDGPDSADAHRRGLGVLGRCRFEAESDQRCNDKRQHDLSSPHLLPASARSSGSRDNLGVAWANVRTRRRSRTQRRGSEQRSADKRRSEGLASGVPIRRRCGLAGALGRESFARGTRIRGLE